MIEVKAPDRPIISQLLRHTFFLAGSIEQGTAVDWQTRVVEGLKDHKVLIYNPRRDHWDPTWDQSSNNPDFNEQVTWELDHMEKANTILIYFDPETKAPVTMAEFGLHARTDKLIVCCPEGFWRKGNVDIMCKRYSVSQVDTLEQLIEKAVDII